MITRDELRHLAQIENTENSAISFYYQPPAPKDKSHREELIHVKDLVREALRHAERAGNHNPQLRRDLQRILEAAERWKGGARAKVVFACTKQDLWREFELPPHVGKSQLIVNDRFHLRPLARLVQAYPRACVVLLDREQARFFSIRAGEITEAGELRSQTPRKVRSDGFAGYDAGHIERHIDNEAMRHFKEVSERLRDMQTTAGCEQFMAGCRDETWPEFEPHLHPYVRERMAGRFVIDPALATKEDVLREANRLIEEEAESERRGLVREVVGESSRNARGAVGLRHVLTALERGEIQSLLIGEDFSGSAVRCANCGHLDTRMVQSCAVCGKQTREIDDVADALVGIAIRNNIRVVYVRDEPEFQRAGNIGALLRFRADQNTSQKQMAS